MIPDKEGYYWAKWLNTGEWVILFVFYWRNELRAERTGDEEIYSLNTFNNWVGPLEPPKE